MGNLIVVDRLGQEHALEVPNGVSVMEAVRNNALDELLALCGGSCSCATCHVYVDEGQEDRISAMSEDENDLLDSSGHRKASSRLSCQLIVNDAAGAIRIAIAPED